ncbi:DinB family protein [Pedobacter metabolipauper]|uniref:DinB family protein n=1 Tax=Pedobacter metabolipauper TaxID=425513 RepID=A0A4R6SX11_9SPHI|nr:DinB family protein [Pedobacter metabolipauper]TDQ08881.1 DinB family protein [Pedobacter metabolipauper]
MIEQSIERLQSLCDNIPGLLLEIDENTFSMKPNPEKWSKKEIIGHLIDSATNNHHRFVRGQFEETPAITYDQNKWNQGNYYQLINSTQIISFWEAYNRQLLELINHLPKEKLNHNINVGTENNPTIGFLIDDYVQHLEHHLKQVLEYSL